MLRLLIVLCLALAPTAALAEDELEPTFPKPAEDGGPALPDEDEDGEKKEDPPPSFPPPPPAEEEVVPSFPAPAAQDELVPSFPTPEPEVVPSFPPPPKDDELVPSFPSPAAELTPSFPPPPAELTPSFPAPPGDELIPSFPAPEGDDDDSGAPVALATPTPAPTPAPPPSNLTAEQLEVFKTTQQLAQRIEQAEQQLTSLAFQQIAASSERRKAELDEQVAAVKADAETMRSTLRRLAGGVDTESLEDAPEETISWEDELADLVAPVVQELKRATERPRETERLRIRSSHYTQKLEQLDAAIGSVGTLLRGASDPLHQAELKLLLEELEESRGGIQDELEVAEGALHSLELETGSFFNALSGVFQVFFADRGRNVLSAMATFLFVLLLLLIGRHFLIRSLGVQTGRRASLWFRVLDLAMLLGTFLAAAFAGLAVLFVSGDWVLLMFAALILFGFFWGARQSIPQFWNEVRLLLNVGPVREGERVMYDDLPWLVESLHFVTILRNPAFPDVYLRLPLSALEELVSRPYLPEEPWFPTKVGDVVDMGDDGWGPIVFQSPEVVQARIQGVLRTYSATDWFAEPPVNLSTGWRSDVLLTLDYSHQDKITDEIPQLLEAYLQDKFQQFELSKHLTKLSVGFEQMGSSSLDLEITGWFVGTGAYLWEAAEEDLASLCVDACNTYGWSIAFPQMTLSNRSD